MVAKFPGTPGPPSTDVRRWRNCSGPPPISYTVHSLLSLCYVVYIYIMDEMKKLFFFFLKMLHERCTDWNNEFLVKFFFFFLLFKEIIIKWCQFKIYTQRVLIYSRDNFFEGERIARKVVAAWLFNYLRLKTKPLMLFCIKFCFKSLKSAECFITNVCKRKKKKNA